MDSIWLIGGGFFIGAIAILWILLSIFETFVVSLTWLGPLCALLFFGYIGVYYFFGNPVTVFKTIFVTGPSPKTADENFLRIKEIIKQAEQGPYTEDLSLEDSMVIRIGWCMAAKKHAKGPDLSSILNLVRVKTEDSTPLQDQISQYIEERIIEGQISIDPVAISDCEFDLTTIVQDAYFPSLRYFSRMR